MALVPGKQNKLKLRGMMKRHSKIWQLFNLFPQSFAYFPLDVVEKRKKRNKRTLRSLSVEQRDMAPNTGIYLLCSSSIACFPLDVVEKERVET
ncbi:hypothetical protein AVEN_132833-1 [Araneus ventricosus]|uniref:Uncharacterized protein n=1 Tax=Araneus ventricosus TaxID=182803 RepID=A0A4Y2BKC2_ARAVE|nr:hypothetical protein AVEN_259427-1 [Araneus ventricosus]GBL92498.1 hypothetical protein AVEN_132833-1 [Araneus ventricosus]